MFQRSTTILPEGSQYKGSGPRGGGQDPFETGSVSGEFSDDGSVPQEKSEDEKQAQTVHNRLVVIRRPGRKLEPCPRADRCESLHFVFDAG